MEETLKGYFWAEQDENLKHFGEITVSTRDKKYEVTIYGSFPLFERQYRDINFHDDIPCLYGYTKERGYVTLIGLRIKGATVTPATGKHSAFRNAHKLSFRQFITGVRTFEVGSKINRLSVSAQFLSGWTKTDPIRQKLVEEKKDGDGKPSQIYELYDIDPVSIRFEEGRCTFYDYISTQHKFDINNLNIQQINCFYFEFNDDLSIEKLYVFLKRFREFYSMLCGVNLGLNSITFRGAEDFSYDFEFDLNISNDDYSSIRSRMRIMSLEKMASGNYLGDFFVNYDQFRLPLLYLMDYLNSDRSDYMRYIQPFVSAMEIIYNKSFRNIDQQANAINPKLKEILDKYQFAPKHRQFLTNAKLAKSYRDLHLKDKLIRLITYSPKLIKLVKDPNAFVQKILDLRHYLVHEVDKADTDLSLLNNRTELGKHIVQMKVVIEYHLLMLMGIEREIVEDKIDITLPNFVHFGVQ